MENTFFYYFKIFIPKVNAFSDSREEVSLSVIWSSHYSSVPYKLEIIDNSYIITDGKCTILHLMIKPKILILNHVPLYIHVNTDRHCVIN